VGNNEDSITVQAAEESAAIWKNPKSMWFANYRDVILHVASAQLHRLPI